MNWLALDLGSQTGFAILANDSIISGTKKLGIDKKKIGARFFEFRNWLIQTIKKHNIDHVFFERVYRHLGTESAHCYGGFMYTLAAICEELHVKCTDFSVQTIKKFMTGKGNATKDEMISAAQLKGFNPLDDNESDAIAILLLAINTTSPKNGHKQSDKRGSSLRERRLRGPAPQNFASVRTF